MQPLQERTLEHAIALTGGIASGKSTIASMLKLYGFAVLCADEIAHECLKSAQDEVVAAFGGAILGENGEIDRKKLGAIVFENREKLEKLENILHPKIRKEIFRAAAALEAHKTPYFIDIPLFFEAQQKNKNTYQISKNLLVYVPQNIQIERLIKRDNISREAAKHRISLQLDIEEKRRLADFVIDNAGDIKATQKELEGFLKKLGQFV